MKFFIKQTFVHSSPWWAGLSYVGALKPKCSCFFVQNIALVSCGIISVLALTCKQACTLCGTPFYTPSSSPEKS